jgi:excisionase family DNA binding protein
MLRVIVRDVVAEVVDAKLAPLLAGQATLLSSAPPALGTVEEAAERLAVSPATVRRWAIDGTIAARRIGRSWKIDLGALRGAK